MLHLEQELCKDFEVWAVCPDRERSATSQAITIRETLRLSHIKGRHYHLNGFPADCVNIGLFSGLFPKFDLVVSGINHGVNLGDDIHFSGTVGAARTAAIHDHLAIAMSSANIDQQGDFRRPAKWLRQFLKHHFDDLKFDTVYNINYPLESDNTGYDAELPGADVTFHGRRVYHDGYELLEETVKVERAALSANAAENRSNEPVLPIEGRSVVLRLTGTAMGYKPDTGSDFETVENGKVSITPLSLRTFDSAEIADLRRVSKL